MVHLTIAATMLFVPAPFIKGVFLGLGAAAPLGPVNVQIARRTLHHGFVAGFFLGCGAVSVDVFYAILSSLSLGQLASDRRIMLPLTAAGVLLLAYLGIQCIRSGLRPATTNLLADPSAGGENSNPVMRQPVLSSYLTGLLMTLLNPMTLAFWFIAVPAIASDLSGAAGDYRTSPAAEVPATAITSHLPMICAGVFVATLSWVVFFAGLLSVARRGRRGSWLRVADLAGGGTLLCMAGATLWRSIRAFL